MSRSQGTWDCGSGEIRLRPAERSDCRLIYAWRNDPRVRRFFFDPREIPFEEHQAWFNDSLARSDRVILVAQQGNTSCGVIRFDFKESQVATAEVDIYVDPRKQGRGIGTRMLELGEQWIEANTRAAALKARILADNEASIRMFQGRGFRAESIHLRKRLGRDAS